jgi:hypothetical protein
LDLCSSCHAHFRERSPSGMWTFPALFTEIPDIMYVSLLYARNDLWVIICSLISAFCHLDVMILGLAFFKDFVPQRYDRSAIWYWFCPCWWLKQKIIWGCN